MIISNSNPNLFLVEAIVDEEGVYLDSYSLIVGFDVVPQCHVVPVTYPDSRKIEMTILETAMSLVIPFVWDRNLDEWRRADGRGNHIQSIDSVVKKLNDMWKTFFGNQAHPIVCNEAQEHLSDGSIHLETTQ